MESEEVGARSSSIKPNCAEPDIEDRSPIEVAGVNIWFDGALESVSEYGGGASVAVSMTGSLIICSTASILISTQQAASRQGEPVFRDNIYVIFMKLLSAEV